ncbi:Uncharacterized protein APZ42_013009, partial [Daphnia magna]
MSNLERSIMGMDSNAKNKLWNSKSTDKRGECLESFINQNKLNIANVPVSKLEYIPQKTAMVDVTLGGDDISILNWHFPIEDSHSDHPIILFQVAVAQPKRSTVNKIVPKLKNIDKMKFLAKLESKVQKIEDRLPLNISKSNLDSIIEELTNDIANSA